ncbi:MAG: ATP-dependent helicase [Clostridiales bacterium]|nr:ATP-dependent helicase [Clostridiales bacterium]
MNILNSAQETAVNHLNSPMMVLAGPGSGKTTVIIRRAKALIEKYGVNPDNILVITFTKAAALEMKSRFESVSNARGVFISTFHSLFYKIISAYSDYRTNNVVLEDERKAVIKNLAVKVGANLDEETLQTVSSEISFIKNDMISLADYHSMEVSDSTFQDIYNAYEDYKKYHNKIDFDDMMVKCYELLSENSNALEKWRGKYKYILIDEFQDINKIQYECVRLLASPENNLFIVGDDDQSIYRFRGARPEFLLHFPSEYPNTETVVLDINYRSTEKIIGLCNRIINKNKIRYGKDIKGTGRGGEMPRILISEDTEAEAVTVTNRILEFSRHMPYSEMAVVYRVNIQSRAFIDSFVNHNIPFQVKDEAPSIYEHWICRDITSYLALALDKTRKDEAARIINRPTRYINTAYINEAKKAKDDFLIGSLISNKKLQQYQKARLSELLFQLGAMKNFKPYAAFKFIRETIGYNSYITSYSEYRKIRPKGLFEIIDELQEGAKSFEKIEDYLGHVEIAKEAAKVKPINRDKPQGVVLSTMHGVKGLEYKVVFIISAVNGLIPHEKSKTADEIEEERRLFYVGATRAKDFLFISFIKNRYENEATPTEFLEDMYKPVSKEVKK